MPIRIFDRYIWRQIFSATLTGVLILTGVMVLGNVFKEMERLLGDTTKLPIMAVIQFIGYVIPYSLIFTIPWALLTAILLVYGRMSADNEMTALRMTGMSMARICVPVFLLSGLMCGACYWVNVHMASEAKTKIKRLFYDLALDDPAVLFQAGKVLDKFPGYRIFTKERDRNHLKHVEIIQTTLGKSERYIRAQNAVIEVTPGVTDFILRLYNAHVETTGGDTKAVTAPEQFELINDVQFADFKEVAITFPLSKLKERTERITNSMKTTSQLWQEVRTGVSSVDGTTMPEKFVSSSRTELSMRYSFSLAAVVFTIVAIPLGITAQRRETSIGFALSFVVVVCYFSFIIFASTQAEKASSYPHLLVWLPNIIFLSMGLYMFWKLSKK